MLFFGWGTKSKTWNLGNGYILLCVYNYFHIWYILRLVTSKRWFIQGANRLEDREISYEQVREILPYDTPKINAYN